MLDKHKGKIIAISLLLVVGIFLGIKFFSEESQNKFARAIGNSMGYKNGQVNVYVGQKEPVMIFLGVEKLSTAIATEDNNVRPYRFGFGFIDLNKNSIIDTNERSAGKKYFELPNYAQYVYFNNSK